MTKPGQLTNDSSRKGLDMETIPHHFPPVKALFLEMKTGLFTNDEEGRVRVPPKAMTPLHGNQGLFYKRRAGPPLNHLITTNKKLVLPGIHTGEHPPLLQSCHTGQGLQCRNAPKGYLKRIGQGLRHPYSDAQTRKDPRAPGDSNALNTFYGNPRLLEQGLQSYHEFFGISRARLQEFLK